MLPLEEIPNLPWIISLQRLGLLANSDAYQTCQVANVDGTSPWHLKYHFRCPVDMRLDKGAGLLRHPNSCLTKSAQDWEAVAFPTNRGPEATVFFLDNSGFVYFLAEAGFLLLGFFKIHQHRVMLKAEHQIVGFEVY